MGQIVTIVGAGIGGLCTGIRLLLKGFNVSIYEKNAHPGGAIGYTFSADGAYHFEESASIPINPLTYFDIFEVAGRKASDYFSWKTLPHTYKVFWSSGKSITLSHNLSQTQETLKTAFPRDVDGYTKCIFDTSLKYLDAKKHLLAKPFIKPSAFLAPSTWYHLLQASPFTTANSYVKSYVHSPELRHLMLFQTFFMGISPYKLSNIYTAIPAQTQVEGLIHIEGGLTAYVEALVKLFEELGGKLYVNHPVTRVVTKGSQVKGIVCHERFIPSQKVVLNADLPYSLKHLVPSKPQVHFVQSCSTCVIHLGLNKHFDCLKTHNIFINHHFKKEMERIFKGKFPQTPSLYLYYPSATDSSFCEDPSHAVLNVMVRVPNLASLPLQWTTEEQLALYRLCMKLLRTIPGLEHLEAAITYRSFTTPRTFKNKYHYTDGSCFGIGHTSLQSMCFRPQVKDSSYSNLYYVGSSIHPGNGASIVMDGAKLLARVMEEETY